MNEAHSIEALSDEAFGWYFTGLTDGEGCFRLSLDHAKKRPLWRADFRLIVRDDEIKNLEAIQRRFNCGTIIRQKARPNSKPTAGWVLSRIEQVANVLVPHFGRFPLQFKKKRDFAIWRQAIPVLLETRLRYPKGRPRPSRTSRRITADELSFLEGLANQLKTVRQYRPPADQKAQTIILPVPQSNERLLPGMG